MPTARKGNTNRQLTAARKARKDEFFTTKQIVEEELHWYQDDFRNRPVLCNCNDWPNSEFVKYFMRKMASLNIPKLIAVGYENTVGTLFEKGHGTLYELVNDGRPADQPYTVDDFKVTKLQGSGGFETPECEKLLDIPNVIVCTNPPFSLFRQFLPLLVKQAVGFLVLGNLNAVTYKEIFPYFIQEKCWMGVGPDKGNSYFRVPAEFADAFSPSVYDAGTGQVHFRNVRWFTNLQGGRTNKNRLSLEGNYYFGHEDKYPMYDDYEAINVDKVADIPIDYSGEIGVPITFLDSWAPQVNDTERERERERERTGSESSESSRTGRPNHTISDIRRSTDRSSTSGSSSDVPSRWGAEAWEGRALGQGGAPVRRNSEIHAASHPTFRMIAMHAKPEQTRISGKSRYARLIIQRTNRS